MIMKAKERAEILQGLIDRMHPDESKEWKEAHLRSLLGIPDQKQHISKPVRAVVPVRKKSTPALYEKINKRIAANFGIELLKGNQIQYR